MFAYSSGYGVAPSIIGRGIQCLVSAVVQDGKLLVVGADIPPAGGGYYTLELPLPK
jgi:hypothetical protein